MNMEYVERQLSMLASLASYPSRCCFPSHAACLCRASMLLVCSSDAAFQQLTPIYPPIEMKPGDALETHLVWNSTSRLKVSVLFSRFHPTGVLCDKIASGLIRGHWLASGRESGPEHHGVVPADHVGRPAERPRDGHPLHQLLPPHFRTWYGCL